MSDDIGSMLSRFNGLIGGDALIAEMQVATTEWLNEKTHDVLREHEGKQYTVSADGYAVQSLDVALTLNIKKNLTISFLQESLSLAVREMKRIFQREIQREIGAQKIDSWVNAPKVRSSVRIFYGNAGSQGVRPIGGIGEIEVFLPGDIVLLVPEYPTQFYANASKFGSNGFMKKASSKIRRKLKVSKRTSPLRISAERSRAAFYEMIKKPAIRGGSGPEAGSEIDITIPKHGMDSAWVIAIRYRKQ